MCGMPTASTKKPVWRGRKPRGLWRDWPTKVTRSTNPWCILSAVLSYLLGVFMMRWVLSNVLWLVVKTLLYCVFFFFGEAFAQWIYCQQLQGSVHLSIEITFVLYIQIHYRKIFSNIQIICSPYWVWRFTSIHTKQAVHSSCGSCLQVKHWWIQRYIHVVKL